jgi:hypothetical protein
MRPRAPLRANDATRSTCTPVQSSSQQGKSPVFKKLLAGVVTAVLSLGVVALVAGPASAHHNTIWPEVSCATNGTYDISWSVENSETGKTEVVSESSLPNVVPNNTSFGFHEKKYFPQNVDTPQSITLSLKGFWDGDTSTTSDDVYNTTSYTLTPDRFPSGCLKVSGDATPKPSECNGPNTYSDPTYTLKDVKGVKYTVNNTDTPAGTYPATNGTSVHIEASVTDPKYTLTGTKVWDFTFSAPTAPCVVIVKPVPPDFKKQTCTLPGQHKLAQYFIPNTTGVIYSVKLGTDDEFVQGTGWFDIPEKYTTVQIIARGDVDHFYKLDGDIKTWDFTIDKAGACLTEVTPKDPGVVSGQCDVANHPGVVPPQTYTLKFVEHVVYEVSTDGGQNFTPVTITADKKFDVQPGTHLVVRATVDDSTKYETKPFNFEFTFGTPGDCKGIVTPLAPEATDQFCDDSGIDGDAGDLAAVPVLVQGTITIFPADNVVYYLDGNQIDPGTYPVDPGPHSVTVTFDASKYKLADGIVLPFLVPVNPGECLPTEPLVTPAVVSSQVGCFSNGSYTLKNDLNDKNAVIWKVNGSTVKQGKYSVSGSGTLKITAAPNAPTFGFADGVQTSWTINFHKPTVCDIETLALTGQNPTGLLVAADLLVVAGLAMFAMRAVRRRPEQA